MNTVDYCSMNALRQLLPHCEREISLTPGKLPAIYLPSERDVLVHPGKSWASRTFPTDWWDGVLHWLKAYGCRPVLFGTVALTQPVQTSGCMDLRGATNIYELIALCQQATVVLTNDSSPVHLASSSDPDNYQDSGHAHIGFLATVRRPELVVNYRCGELGWRMQNLATGGLWEHFDFCPNRPEGYTLNDAPEELVRSWLPDPRDVAEWGAARIEKAPGDALQ